MGMSLTHAGRGVHPPIELGLRWAITASSPEPGERPEIRTLQGIAPTLLGNLAAAGDALSGTTRLHSNSLEKQTSGGSHIVYASARRASLAD
jgi:hypothetical protein